MGETRLPSMSATESLILDMLRVCARRLRGEPVAQTSEAPYQVSRLTGVPEGSSP